MKLTHGILNPADVPQNGIVFLYAEWSGQSRMLLPVVSDIVAQHPTLPFYVYDIDEPQYTGFASAYTIKSHGMGEAFWIKNSEVVASLNINTYSREKVIVYCELLLPR